LSKIESFLKTFNSKSTVRAYRWALSRFFESVYGHNETSLEEHAEKYLSEDRDYEEDLEGFLANINGEPPKSVRLMISAVRTFLVENDIELSDKFWRRLRGRIKGSRALTIDKVPSNAELKQVIMHMPIHGKALYLCLSSSGMRIGEALKLKLSDIELDKDPPVIHIRGEYTKTGNSRVAFISREALESLSEWFKVRSKYLESASGKSHIFVKDKEDDRVFPFEISTAHVIWRNALAKTGLYKKDSSTNRNLIHPHVLRKFFRTRLGSVIPTDVAEALMGHEGYLTEVYRRYTVEDLAKFYKQGEGVLTIFSNAEEVSKLKVEVEEKNKQLQSIINGLVSENLELKERMAKVEKILEKIAGELRGDS